MADHRTFGAHQLYLAARKETGDRRSPGRPSTVNNRGEFAAVVSETRTLKTLQEFSSVDPAVQIDFNQVAASSLAKRAGVLAESAPSPFKHTWDWYRILERTSRMPGSPPMGGYFIVLVIGATALTITEQ
jgi:hypothetical protein